MISGPILFEGLRLDVRSIGRVFRRGSTVVAELDGLAKVLHHYDSPADTEMGKRYLLVKLDRRRTWI